MEGCQQGRQVGSRFQPRRRCAAPLSDDTMRLPPDAAGSPHMPFQIPRLMRTPHEPPKRRKQTHKTPVCLLERRSPFAASEVPLGSAARCQKREKRGTDEAMGRSSSLSPPSRILGLVERWNGLGSLTTRQEWNPAIGILPACPAPGSQPTPPPD